MTVGQLVSRLEDIDPEQEIAIKVVDGRIYELEIVADGMYINEDFSVVLDRAVENVKNPSESVNIPVTVLLAEQL